MKQANTKGISSASNNPRIHYINLLLIRYYCQITLPLKKKTFILYSVPFQLCVEKYFPENALMVCLNYERKVLYPKKGILSLK